ncbi:serine carboxypeptidase-like protein [Stylonychia lemnae]|uniref:Carboxypeptidase n=1 Tax=Stylonychia lemnae TaxID=5949 RepID=A0A078B103_STYLE|nr:serine carboxypeptidase-like protein [Stylonychia lemnae]|eukprot:CDW88011.1 serine carboxypeptidase-like protein [Stylonychia lemnae]
MFKSIAAIAMVGLASVANAYPEVDRVHELLNWPQLTFGLYSGYLPVNNSSKQLHYMGVMSQRDQANDPVIIWFNGGPGCSSMLGFLQEHGPVVLDDGATEFKQNPYSWNREANMFYIESPAGVGYSVCPDQSECNFDDDNSADDNLQAVLTLLQKFPELQHNDLYLAGESYAGIYVPKLAERIDAYLTDNENRTDVYKPNFKGFMVGNGVTDWRYDTVPAFIEMSVWHGLIKRDLYDRLMQCDFSYFGVNPTFNLSAECNQAFEDFNTQTQELNVYDVYGQCYIGNQSQTFQQYESFRQTGFLQSGLEEPSYKKYFTAADYTPFLNRNFAGKKSLKESPPCVFGDPIIAYLNNPQVKSQLNIYENSTSWDLCSMINYNSGLNGSVDIYPKLKGKYRMLKYSGDTDGAVPTLGTLKWINDLNWNITEQYRPYYVYKNDGFRVVAGFTESREGNFTFASIHGTGHMAPQWKRQETYHLIFSFINGQAP